MEWWRGGKLHRSDGPAIVDLDTEEWWNCGELHREQKGSDSGPAISTKLQDLEIKQWYSYGKLHRDWDLPAHISTNRQEWHRDGLLHREGDLPSLIDTNQGVLLWHKEGLLHREGGLPAYIYGENLLYYIDGVQKDLFEL
jgi:hypothetical protein